MVDELLAFAKRTDSRSLAVGALNVLVETNCISDLVALSRIDDWKDAHRCLRMTCPAVRPLGASAKIRLSGARRRKRAPQFPNAKAAFAEHGALSS